MFFVQLDPENELDSDCTLDLINPSSSCSLTSGYSHSVNTTPSISGMKRKVRSFLIIILIDLYLKGESDIPRLPGLRQVFQKFDD